MRMSKFIIIIIIFLNVKSFLSNDTNLLTLFAIVLELRVFTFCMSLRKKKTPSENAFRA